MSKNNSTHFYTFLDFQFSPLQRTLLRGSQPLNLSKKNHEILLALIESNGHVIKKDQLIDAVWPNQIVTDAALNKQITRLRQTLNPNLPQSVIETVRGVGFRFVPEIHRHTQEQVQNQSSPSYYSKAVLIAALLVCVLLAFSWYLKRDHVNADNTFDDLQTINLGLVPGLNNQDWLNLGGINYLSDQLLAYETIQTIKPEYQWFNRTDQDVLGIELSQNPGIQFVLMVENQTKDDQYTANLLLRNKSNIVAKESLQAASVILLLNKIEVWTLEQLNVSAEIINNKQKNQSVATDFVMESYLRGLAAANARQYTQAIQLLETALDQDAEFYPAWFTLAEVEAELGHFDKALGLIETLHESGKLTSELQRQLAPIKAKNLVYLNRLDEAQDILNQSNQAEAENPDVNIVMKNLATQALLNDYNGELGLADLKSTKKLLELTKKYAPSPNKIGSVLHNLAANYRAVGEHENAIKTIELAIQNFRSADNAEGLVSSYRLWADFLYFQAQNGKALLVLDKAIPWLSRVEGARTLALFWMTKARTHYEEGELAPAQSSVDELNLMSVTYSTQQPKVKALIIEVEIAISYGFFAQARTAVDALLAIITVNPGAYPTDAPYAVALDLYLLVRVKDFESVKIKKQQYLAAYPELADYIKYELKRIDAHIMAADGFEKEAIQMLEELENHYLQNGDILTANYINYEILYILTPTNTKAFEQALNRLAARNHFAYPFKKFKAQHLAQQNNLIQAVTLLSELKVQAKSFWTAQDQLLLEAYQHRNSQN